MSMTSDQRVSESGPAQPYSSWSGPGGPGGPGEAPGRSARPPRRRRVLAFTAGLAVAASAAVGIAWTTAQASTQPVLTTSEITAQTDPALVDVVSTLGYQHGSAEGTGMVLTPTGEVLTNNHVVDGATSIKVTDVGDGRTYRAVVTGYDQKD